MALFISASDEHSGNDGRGAFLFAGFIGPEEDWSRFFVPAWQERVLDGPPRIPYLHMTDIRSKSWRNKWGLSRLAAEDRIDEAISIIETMGSFYPMLVEIDGGHTRDAFAESKVVRSEARQFEAKPFEPDYISFLTYAYGVLDYVHRAHATAEKVDFIVEQKGYITRYINEFHSSLARALTSIGRPELAPLVGALSVGDKERIPCQAADVLCWYSGRFNNESEIKPEDIPDLRRYLKLRNRKGNWITLQNDVLSDMATAILPAKIAANDSVGESPSGVPSL